MALIRQANAAAAARDAIVLDLGDLKRQAEAIRTRALAEADQIIAEAQAQRHRMLADASREGHAQGYAKGLEEGAAKGAAEGTRAALSEHGQRLGKIDQAWSAAVSDFESRRRQLLLEARHDCLKLAVALGERIAKRAIECRPESVIDQAAAALELLGRGTRATIASHPDDIPLLQEALPAVIQSLASAAHVELMPDPSVERGGCILRTGSGGQIDATISTQLQRIVEALLPTDVAPTSTAATDAAGPPGPAP